MALYPRYTVQGSVFFPDEWQVWTYCPTLPYGPAGIGVSVMLRDQLTHTQALEICNRLQVEVYKSFASNKAMTPTWRSRC